MTRKIFMGFTTVLLVLCLCLVFIHNGNQNKGTSTEEKINAIIEKYHVQGASYAIIKDGQVASIHNFGYADVEQKNMVADNTAFKIASISKTVTAYAIMQLVDQNILNLDAPVQDYIKNWTFPESEYDNFKVTLRTLLSHTSGISDSPETGYTEPFPTVEEALTQRNISVIRDPGSQFEYSSFSGFAICQLVIENVTGQKFEDYMQQYVFAPLNMNQAGYYNQSQDNYCLATPYAGLEKAVPVTPIVMTGAGGISATSTDMANFVIAMINYFHSGNQEMFRAQKHTESAFGVYGLGIIPHQLADGTIVYEHNGTLTGWNAQIAFEPESQNGIVFLCNSDKGYYLTNEVMRIWSTDLTGYPVEDKAFQDKMEAIINAVWVVVTLTSSLLLTFFVDDTGHKNRKLLRGRKNCTRLIISLIISSVMLLGWYGIMYSDIIFEFFYNTANYYPFTFFTRNIDWVGFSLIFMSMVLIMRRLYPKSLSD